MRIEHIALWTADLERMRAFYEQWFGAVAGPLYENPAKGFRSFFLRFSDGARLELMQRADVPDQAIPDGENARPAQAGYAHFALSLGSPAAVDALAEAMSAAGRPIIDGPRTTGDGYYECVIADPDGNRIEITV